MTTPVFPAVDPAVPTGAVYSILLLLHVACAVIGFGALTLTGIQARRARRGPAAPGADGVRRFFRPGVNGAARTLYGVPLFGFALISSSHGAFSAGDAFVIVGLALWSVATLVAEFVVWPGERRIQDVVSGQWDSGQGDSGQWDSGQGDSGQRDSGQGDSGQWESGHRESGHRESGHRESGHRESGHRESGGERATTVGDRFDSDCRRVAGAAAVLSVVFLAAVVLMVAQP